MQRKDPILNSMMPLPKAPPLSNSPEACLAFLPGLLASMCCVEAEAESTDCTTSTSSTTDTGTGCGMEVEHQSQQQQQEHCPQHKKTQQLISADRLSSNASCRSSNQDQHKNSIILPHLRFHPLPPPSGIPGCSPSSLKGFFDLFLADNAPHSFQLFHEWNGDSNVRTSLWKDVTKKATNNLDENACEDKREQSRRLERTVTFLTKITPGSSSNPLSQSERVPSCSGNTTIPLQVIILQSLVRLKNRWMLRCDFSFDFQSSVDNFLGVGRKLGTGLGQYLMSNVIKTSLVSVTVTLSECSDGIVAFDDTRIVATQQRHIQPGTSRDYNNNNKRIASSTVPLKSCRPSRRTSCSDEGFRWCLTHPLLLMPPDGLCIRGNEHTGDSLSNPPSLQDRAKGNVGSNAITNVSFEESRMEEAASLVGASLLSAIRHQRLDRHDKPKVKNAPYYKYNAERSVAMNAAAQPAINKTSRNQLNYHLDDVLTCSSTNSLKTKHISSFGLERSPSTASATVMRNMLLEKDCAAVKTAGNTSNIAPNFTHASRTSRDTGYGLLFTPSLSPSHTQQHQQSSRPLASHGLSMCIQMDIGSTTNSFSNTIATNISTTSSLSNTFSRSASFTGIDEKVRRGLKKRIARNWIRWAESWCMRLWEEERKLPGEQTQPPRKKVNVRPQVRRIPKKSSEEKATLLKEEQTLRICDEKKFSEEEARAIADKKKALTNKVWNRSKMEDCTSFDRNLWISLDECIEGYGVEVSCAMLSSSSSLVAPSKTVSSVSKIRRLSRSWSSKSSISSSQPSLKKCWSTLKHG